MMAAPSLPPAQTAMPAGFGAFLAKIGQGPVDGGESPSFDQLLAAAPATTAPGAAAVTTIRIEQGLPAEATTPTVDASPIQPDMSAQTPAVKVEPVGTDAEMLRAANLLAAMGGAVPGNAPATGKPVATETGTEAETADASEVAAPAPSGTWAAVAATIVPAAAKPAKPAEAVAVAADTNPAAPVAARTRDAAPPVPVLTGTEPQGAKPLESAPSMTILFAQPAAQAAAMRADVAAPVQLAERVLDMDSDGAWIDQLARDIAATKSDSGDISFRLMPKHLGRLDVAMQMGDQGMSLKMDTHHESTATIVTAAHGRLVDELRQQGVRVAGAEVTCTPGETGRQSTGQGQGRAATPDPVHLVETATERAEPRPDTDSKDRAADRRGRFA